MDDESNKKKNGSPWTAIIIGVFIFVLFTLWVNARNENERANSIFYLQTGQALNNISRSSTATQEILNKIIGCININYASQYLGTYQCIFGVIIDVRSMPVDPSDPNSPPIDLAYFSFMPNQFYILGPSLSSYITRCVKVYGKILVDSNGTPGMAINDDFGQGRDIEVLPENVCKY